MIGAVARAALGGGSDSAFVVHLSREQFATAMRYCAVMAGNSSAGIIEAASFGTPVVNVGERQNLRERNRNVNDCGNDEQAIRQAKLGDFSEVNTLLALLQAPFDEHPGFEVRAGFPPDWASSIEISCSS